MRLINADELMEHVWRDKLDSRELIAKMIENAPTIKEIPTNIPIDIFEKLISQEPKTGHWLRMSDLSEQADEELEPCEDVISREDALMAITGEWTEPTDELIHRFIKRIKKLPPVNPQPKTWNKPCQE
jgi:hypothetical protein